MDTTATQRATSKDGTGKADCDEKQWGLCSRGLMYATLVVALVGFAGTAFSAAPAEMFGQPATCIVSH